MNEHDIEIETGNDLIVSALISELKTGNAGKDKTINNLLHAIYCFIVAGVVLVCGFLWYLNQYDYVSSESISTNGIYTLVDSDGNVVAQDLSPEDIDALMEVLNGTSNSETNQNED